MRHAIRVLPGKGSHRIFVARGAANRPMNGLQGRIIAAHFTGERLDDERPRVTDSVGNIGHGGQSRYKGVWLIVLLAAGWLLLPIVHPTHVEGFSASIVSLALHLN